MISLYPEQKLVKKRTQRKSIGIPIKISLGGYLVTPTRVVNNFKSFPVHPNSQSLQNPLLPFFVFTPSFSATCTQ